MRPEILNPLFCSAERLKGIGTKYFKLIKNLCGEKVLDLLFHLPVNLIDRTYCCPLNRAQTGRIWTGLVKITSHMPGASKKQPYRIMAEDETDILTLNFFKYYQDCFSKNMPEGSFKAISGRLESFNGRLQMNHPDYILDPEMLESLKTIEPVYPLSAGVTNKMLLKLIRQAFEILPDLPEWQNPAFMAENGFSSFKQSLLKAHHPLTIQELEPSCAARKRLAYDELLANQLTLALARKNIKKKSGRSIEGNGSLRQILLQGLAFELTPSQKNVLEEIYKDQKAPYKMMRLLQGDVGSGKTVVAALVMLNAVECGAQAAIMAPTEILAKQHFETISAYLTQTDVRIALLTGKTKTKAREQILEDLKSGKIQILIGTHALFTDDVCFKDLACVVVDEQHRFGVKQRLSLTTKGNNADVLVMTATPIPRTLVLTAYGDMDYSKIAELPKGRRPVETLTLGLNKIDEVVAALKRRIDSGDRAYWVCPLVEESEKTDLAAAEERFRQLQKIFGDKTGLIHGKMKEKEKDEMMYRFKNGEISLLVSTTVIEVGVNVPEAVIMVIERAERFGLAQLHQLRGRIRRGQKDSTCILVYGFPLSDTAKARLKIMKESEDGFLIAEKDLELRGGGEILGTRQSGFQNFKLADMSVHKELLYCAKKDADLILATDPDLKSERGRALRVLLYLFECDDHFKTYLSG